MRFLLYSNPENGILASASQAIVREEERHNVTMCDKVFNVSKISSHVSGTSVEAGKSLQSQRKVAPGGDWEK